LVCTRRGCGCGRHVSACRRPPRLPRPSLTDLDVIHTYCLHKLCIIDHSEPAPTWYCFGWQDAVANVALSHKRAGSGSDCPGGTQQAEKVLDIAWQLSMPDDVDAPPELLQSNTIMEMLEQYNECSLLVTVRCCRV
jgi:hypothetical protein